MLYGSHSFSCYEEGVLNLWKPKPALGMELALAWLARWPWRPRYGFRRAPRERIPDDISPAIFATRVTETIFGR